VVSFQVNRLHSGIDPVRPIMLAVEAASEQLTRNGQGCAHSAVALNHGTFTSHPSAQPLILQGDTVVRSQALYPTELRARR
jgi:hypothetical protein